MKSIKSAILSRVQVPMVRKELSQKNFLNFCPKNQKSPWKTRTFLLGCKIVAPIWLPRTRLRVFGHRTQLNFEPPMASLVANFPCGKICPCASRASLSHRRLAQLFGHSGEKSQRKNHAFGRGFPLAPPAGLEPATTWLTVRCSTDWAKEEYKRKGKPIQFPLGVGYELSSRAVSSQVFSPLQRLTSVFGMGTGGPTALK